MKSEGPWRYQNLSIENVTQLVIALIRVKERSQIRARQRVVKVHIWICVGMGGLGFIQMIGETIWGLIERGLQHRNHFKVSLAWGLIQRRRFPVQNTEIMNETLCNWEWLEKFILKISYWSYLKLLLVSMVALDNFRYWLLNTLHK